MRRKKYASIAIRRVVQLICEFCIHLPAPVCVFYYTLLGNIKIGKVIISNTIVLNLWLMCTVLTCIAYIKIFYHKKNTKFTIAFSSFSTCVIYFLKMMGQYYIAGGILFGVMCGVIVLWKRGKRNIFYMICVTLFFLSCIVFSLTNIWRQSTILKSPEKNREREQYNYKSLIQQIDYFDTYSIEKKMTYLQELVTLEAEHLGIEEHIEVYAATLNDGTNGLFRTDWENMIFINRNYLTDPDTESLEIIRSTLHELHHCYVNKVILLMKKML